MAQVEVLRVVEALEVCLFFISISLVGNRPATSPRCSILYCYWFLLSTSECHHRLRIRVFRSMLLHISCSVTTFLGWFLRIRSFLLFSCCYPCHACTIQPFPSGLFLLSLFSIVVTSIKCSEIRSLLTLTPGEKLEARRRVNRHLGMWISPLEVLFLHLTV